MLRPFTLLCLAACCGSGLYLYAEKHRAELLDRQIAHVIHATEAARQTTSLLRAEWGLLNNPDRLRPMAEKYLGLTTMQPAQWVQLADLGARLPPPVAPGQAGSADDDSATDPPSPELPPPGPPESQPLESQPPGSQPPESQTVAVAPADPGIADPAPSKPVVPVRAAKPAAHAAPRKAPPPAMVADRELPAARHNQFAHSMPLALATPQPTHPHVLSAMARPVPLHTARPAVMAAVPSTLGMREAVPPPVPLGAE